MRVYLLRHGATEATAEGRYSGRLDTPLSPAGRQALHRAAFSPQYVYVSPLRRAVETAALWFPEAKQIPVPELREMDFGIFEGRTWRELSDNAAYRAWVDSGCQAPIPGGESKAVFCARVQCRCRSFGLGSGTADGHGGGCSWRHAHGSVGVFWPAPSRLL